YSDELDEVKDQLIAMGFIAPVPLDSAQPWHLTLTNGKTVEGLSGGNKYVLSAPDSTKTLLSLDQVEPGLAKAMKAAVRQFGYLPEQDLVAYCYSLPEFKAVEEGELIFESDIPDRVEVPLSEDECDDLELI